MKLKPLKNAIIGKIESGEDFHHAAISPSDFNEIVKELTVSSDGIQLVVSGFFIRDITVYPHNAIKDGSFFTH